MCAPDEYASRHGNAVAMQMAYGCPGAEDAVRPTELRVDLEEETRMALETTGALPLPKPGEEPKPLAPCHRRCFFEAAFYPSPWASELIAAAGEMRESKGGVTFLEYTGRKPTVADLRFLRILRASSSDALASDHAIREAQRAQREAEEKARRGGG